jgi:hypothetical protein
MSTQTRNNKVGYYLCSGLNDETYPCDNGNYINTGMIDDNLYPILFDHTYIKEILTRDSSDAISLNEKKNQIEYYNSEITSLEMTEKRFKNLYATGYLEFEDMTKEVVKVINQITDIKNKVSLLNSDIQTISKKDIDEIIKNYKDATEYDVKREFVTKYINSVVLHSIDLANVKWMTPLQKNEKMIFIEMYAFNYKVPLKVLLTPYSKNVIVSKTLQYLSEYNMVVDTSKKLK